jgi:hypothetical protein
MSKNVQADSPKDFRTDWETLNLPEYITGGSEVPFLEVTALKHDWP